MCIDSIFIFCLPCFVASSIALKTKGKSTLLWLSLYSIKHSILAIRHTRSHPFLSIFIDRFWSLDENGVKCVLNSGNSSFKTNIPHLWINSRNATKIQMKSFNMIFCSKARFHLISPFLAFPLKFDINSHFYHRSVVVLLFSLKHDQLTNKYFIHCVYISKASRTTLLVHGMANCSLY